MIKKRFATVLLKVGVVLLLLSGCSKPLPVLHDGIYKMTKENKDAIAPTILFNMKDKTFQFDYDYLSSYATVGTIVINNDNVVGTTADKKYSYTFVIVNQETLRFVAGKSSTTKTVEGKTAIPDGSEFKYVEGSAKD